MRSIDAERPLPSVYQVDHLSEASVIVTGQLLPAPHDLAQPRPDAARRATLHHDLATLAVVPPAWDAACHGPQVAVQTSESCQGDARPGAAVHTVAALPTAMT